MRITIRRILVGIIQTQLALLCLAQPRRASPSYSLAQPDRVWVRKTLKSMTLHDKVAQLIAIRVPGKFLNKSGREFESLAREVRDSRVGALVLFAGNVYESAALLNELQLASKLPLLVASDFERGASFRITDTTSFPYNMGVGAAGSEDYAYQEGVITAREARALGVHWVYAPVLDVSNNPDNPVINIRSFGEDPQLVARLGSAFIKGARANGVLTTAKHFPGHGDTSTDTHIGLAVVSADRARLDSVELVPFRRAIDAGLDSIMTAHVAVPAITGDPNLPATLSPKILTGLLRDDLAFKGLVVTDAMEMGGITTRYWTGLAAIRALQAGADMILLPPDTDVAINEVVRAVKRGDIAEARIDSSVEKVLAAKTQVGLHKKRTVPLDRIASVVGSPEAQRLGQTMADASITLLKDERRLLPLDTIRPPKLFTLVMSSDPDTAPGAGFLTEMRRRFPSARTLGVDTRITQDVLDAIGANIGQADIIVCATIVRVISGKGNITLPANQQAIFDQLMASGKPVVWVALGNPYLLPLYPQVSAYMCTFGYADVSQAAAAKALAGEIAIGGKMPVSIPGQSSVGDGLQVPASEMKLNHATPEQAGLPGDAFVETKKVLASQLGAKAFPGASLIVGYRGRIVLDTSVGRLTYDAGSSSVSADTIYDLASLSKAIGTTSAAMMLAESGRLLLDAAVQDYLPEFKGPDKEKIRVHNLLTHSAGLPAFLPLYKETQGYENVLARIYSTPLQYEPGTKSVYSDLGMILLGEIIARASGQTLDRFIGERLFAPLDLQSTLYKPGKALLPRIAPTENDPWRKRVVRGEVHDENAFAMGGVAGHAGLFSSARDVAVFAQMMLNDGVYDHRRFFAPSTVRRFTSVQGRPEWNRSFGWAKPSAPWTNGIFSPEAFGHTGFTGTMLWVDPARQLFIVLLTNRVHPSRENTKIEEARRAVCEAVVKAVEGASGQRAGTQ